MSCITASSRCLRPPRSSTPRRRCATTRSTLSSSPAATAAPLGWVTSRGILHNHAREWATAASAADAISEPAATVAPTATLDDALTVVFVATSASHILVASDIAQAPVGVIADSDLVAFMAR
jgi:CBS-domain-containing membrane protein